MKTKIMTWRNWHLIVGSLGLLLFALQGQYMTRILVVTDLPDAARMMYRSAHIYLMLACVANVCAGYFAPYTAVTNHLQRLIRLVILVSPAMFIWSFFNESTISDLDRPIATAALYLLFGSAVLLFLHDVYRRMRGAPTG